MRLPRRWIKIVALAFFLGWGLVLWFLHEALDRDISAVFFIPSEKHHAIQLSRKVPALVIPEDKKEAALTRPHVRPSNNYIIDPNDLWEQPTDPPLPGWMKDYFRWFKEMQQHSSNKNDPKKIPYLLLACPKGSRKCGGTVDRLSPLVFLIYVASRTHRLFIIHWGRPAPLESFLVPPVGGVDWRLGNQTIGPTESILATTLESLLEAADSEHQIGVRCRYQAPDHGAGFYNSNRAIGEPTMAQITRTVWEILFTPTPPVAERIQQFLTNKGLVPHHYLATHIRALYAVSDQDPYLVQYWTFNAVNCTTHLAEKSDVPSTMFVASDASFASKLAQRYGKQHDWRVVFHVPDVGQEPLHLDKASHWQDRPPSDYYDTFVDLYLLGLSRCLTYGVGGYGKFASWLTGNPMCAFQHHNATGARECTILPPHDVENNVEVPQSVSGALFRPPMGTAPMNRQLSANDAVAKTIISPKSEISMSDENRLPTFPDTRRHPPLENLWEASTVLPQWMKDYFVWHREQKNSINSKNWLNFRYLVVECSRFATKCGGTSDRLRPIPYYIRVAAQTTRILLIHWEKPRALETFLLPPYGGMDWRTPEWLVQHLQHKVIKVVKNLADAAARNDVLVQGRIQADDHGSHYYDNSTAVVDGEGPLAFRRHYHDCWYVLFTPVPIIATMIENQLLKSGLKPGLYGVAHVRALYRVETEWRDPVRIADWTRKAIDCLSELRPGPYFVASDSHDARKAALEYSRERNVHIVTRSEASVPVHMDIADASQDVTSLYDVFVDLYLMSFGRCLVYNMGGFGKWAQLLSGHDFTCNIRWNTPEKSCTWNESASLYENTPDRGAVQSPLFLPPIMD
eukprot:scaffold5237_cov179-Amphora_coffeaeformis.AAC.5